MSHDPLIARWSAWLVRAGLHDENDRHRHELFRCYLDPSRHYHNLDHIASCFVELDGAPDPGASRPAIKAAIWYHDCIYDPRRSDNEVCSAEVAAKALAEMGAQKEFTQATARLILATRHAAVPVMQDEQLLCDIDLSILGKPPEVFAAYEREIRQEYAHVSDEAFRAGRAAVLRRFLSRPHIYCTRNFRDRYEAPARRNLQDSLCRLI